MSWDKPPTAGSGVSGTGTAGINGASAYEIAVANGFSGTQAQWLASLVGPQGPPGANGTGGGGSSDLTPYVTVGELTRTVTHPSSIAVTDTLVPLGAAVIPSTLVACSLVFASAITGQDASNYWTVELGKFSAYSVDDTDTGVTFSSIAAKPSFGASGSNALGELIRPRMAWTFDAAIFDYSAARLMDRDTIYARWTKTGAPGAVPSNVNYTLLLEPLR